MNSYDYGWEKLHLAMHSLAGPGDVKSRLVSAVIYNLIHITPENDLPPSMREEFEDFLDAIASEPAEANEGTVQATVESLDETGVQRAIETIIGFYDRICRYQEPH